MQLPVLTRPKVPVDLRALAGTAVTLDHADLVVDQPTTVVDQAGQTVLYHLVDPNPGSVTEACQSIRFAGHYRTAGLPTISKVFGFEPRKALRKDFCSATALARENPAAHEALEQYALRMREMFEACDPERVRDHAEKVAKVLPEYRMRGDLFTSGIVNRNNVLRYHWDRGNYPGLWSAMIVVRHRTQGGELVLPEYRTALKCQHGSILLFPGQSVLHGVTPILRQGFGAFRYSVVYYALRQMWNCLPIEQELERIRKVKSARETKRAERSKS